MDTLEYKYVDTTGNIIKGEEAKKALSKKSDRDFLSDDGVVCVSRERWKEAQKYEATEWLFRAALFNDDRNFFHEKNFNNYDFLNDEKSSIRSMIELGCGPFTNARVILKHLPSVEKVALLDPLLEGYKKFHRNCTYKDGTLNSKKVTLLPSSIEDCEFDEKYDLVVMINVLEHCYDVPKIFQQVLKILNKGGVFIFSDVYFSNETIEKLVDKTYNAGHPIRVSEKFLNNFLNDNFNKVYEKIIDEQVAGLDAKETYYVGKKI